MIDIRIAKEVSVILKNKKKVNSPETSNIRIDNIFPFLNYKRFDENGYLVLPNRFEKGNYYADILSVEGKNLDALSHAERIELLTSWGNFNGQFLDDIQLISSKFPTNTELQQSYWGKKYATWRDRAANTSDELERGQYRIRMHLCMTYITQEQQIETKLYNYDFCMVFFANSVSKLKDRVRTAKELGMSSGNSGVNKATSAVILHDMTQSAKEEVLFKLNNPNAKMK